MGERIRAMLKHASTTFTRKVWPQWFSEPLEQIGVKQSDPMFASVTYVYKYDEITHQAPIRIPTINNRKSGPPE
eukprot:3091166-Pyramimonas_sp.AAC.1